MEDLRIMDAAGATTKAEWLSRIEEIGEEIGYFERLGRRHFAFLNDAGPTLLVSFEALGSARGGDESQMPLGHRIAARKGWSSLSIIADGETWFRDPAVYGYFDRLVDDSFFEDFDRVVFYGAGMGAYAAAAYSVAAPGATVIVLQPVATLDPAQCEWDDRFSEHRRLDFTSRYGYAPDMIDGAGGVFVLYDPEEPLDAMQAALFRKPHVTALRCRKLGGAIEPMLGQMDILVPMVEAACEGRLTSSLFFRLYRARRQHGGYSRGLLAKIDKADRPVLAAILCRSVLKLMNRPRFRKRLSELEEELEELGLTLPPERAPAPRD